MTAERCRADKRELVKELVVVINRKESHQKYRNADLCNGASKIAGTYILSI